MLVNRKFSLLIGLCGILALSACGGNDQKAPLSEAQAQSAARPHASQHEQVHLDVYKSETCGCCQGWMDKLEGEHFHMSAHHPEDLAGEKAKLGIEPRLQSCHTAVSEEGYVFEGHIPGKLIRQFLAEAPGDAVGLAVPGMPVGSPGMEMGDRFTPYEVLLIKKDGSTEVYASIETAAQQY